MHINLTISNVRRILGTRLSHEAARRYGDAHGIQTGPDPAGPGKTLGGGIADMGKPTGFMQHDRQLPERRPVEERVRSLEAAAVRWIEGAGRPVRFEEVPGSQRIWTAGLVLLAMGFTGPESETIAAQLDLALDDRGNIRTGSDFMTSHTGVFAAGDARRGQSLIVWAISEGREAARAVDRFLMGHSDLPRV